MRMLRGGGAAAIVTMALVVVPGPPAVGAASDFKSQIQQLKTTLTGIAAELDQAEHDLEEAEHGIARHRRALTEAQTQHKVLRASISQRAAEMYRTADAGPLQLLAETKNIDVVLDRMSYLDALRRGETEMLETVTALRRRSSEESAALRAVHARARQIRSRLAERQSTLQAKLSELQRLQNFLGSVSGRTVIRGSRGGPRGIVCPVVGSNIVSNNYGDPRPGGPHAGIDIRASYGQYVRAVLPGTVVDTPYGSWIGIGIILRDLAGNEWWYAHLSSESVRVGQRVASGEVMGRVGCTGNCYGNHLHFEYHPGGGDPRNPYSIVAPVC